MTLGGVRAIWHLCHGIAPVQGGAAGLAMLVREKLATYGGVVADRPVAVALDAGRRRVDAVLTDDGARFGAHAVVFADGAAALRRVWPAAPSDAGPTAPGGRLRVSLDAADRSPGLQDPCAWLATPGGPAARVRVDGQGLAVTWWGDGAPPPLDDLVPLARLDVAAPTPHAWPTPDRSLDPLGLFRDPARGGPRNLVFAGPDRLPGLGLEGECLTALLAADAAARFCPRRRGV